MPELVGGRQPSRTRLLSLLVFGTTLVVYLATLPPSVLPGDSGELIAASYTLSIAHPPGHPLYVMLGKIFASVFAFGSVGYRYNLFSAVAASAASALVFLIMARVGVGSLLALAATLGLATLQSYWFQATTADVYALNALFTALLVYVSLLGTRYGERTLLILGLIGGLALSHHLSLVYPLMGSVVIFLLATKSIPRPGTWIVSGFLLALGLTTWLYIPIRAHLGPPLTWGDTDKVSGFLSHVTAQGYRWRLRTFEPGQRVLDFLTYFKVLAAACGVPLISLACLGLVWGLRKMRALVGLPLMIGFYGIHYAMYNIPDIESHLFPATLGVAVLAGLGLQGIYNLPRLPRAVRIAVGCFAFLIVVLNVGIIEPRKDQWFAHDYAEAIEASAEEACGKDCIVITSGDMASFPLFYAVLTEPGSVQVYDMKISSPRTIGARERPKTVEQCAAQAAEKFGAAGVAMLGAAPSYVMGQPTRMCGMVYVIDGTPPVCKSPLAYSVRGVGEDLRDYSSRLLAGTYYLQAARWFVQERDVVKAREYADRAVRAAYDDVGIHIYASRLYLDVGEVDQALKLARLAVKVDPDFFGAHDMLANIVSLKGKNDEAIAEYRKALKGNPHPAPVYSNLGNAYVTKGDWPNAVENLRKAIELDSTLVNAYVSMGRASEAQGKLEEALEFFEHARRHAPASEPASHAEASLLLRMEKSDRARSVIEEALGSQPRSALLLSDLGLVNLREGSLDSAITYLEKALATDPSMLTARGNLAVAYEGKGLKTEAIEQYEIYLKTAPPGKPRDRASEALHRLQASP